VCACVCACVIACTASFNALSPSSGHAFGSQLITLFGGGFSPVKDEIFFCSFTCGAVERFSPSGMPVLNNSRAVCTVPAWKQAPCVAKVALYRFGVVRIPGEGVFRFLPGWLNLAPLSSPNGGGTLITVSGSGFDASLDYKCRLSLTSDAGINVVASGTVLQPETILCESPQWVYGTAANCSIAIEQVDGNGNIQTLPKITGRDFTFRYVAGSASVVQPIKGLASGGHNITVIGVGFHAYQSQYSSHLARYSANFSQYGYSAVSKCTPVTAEVLTCFIPYWGHGEMTVVLTIYQGSTLVPTLHDIPFEFTFSAAWHTISPSLGPVETAMTITVLGAGFSSMSIMSCLWTPVFTDGSVMSTPITVVSDTKLSCSTPSAAIAHVLSLSLQREDQIQFGFGRLLNFTGIESSEFQLVPTLDTIVTRHAVTYQSSNTSKNFAPVVAAAGGSRITVAGRGFNAAHSYRCMFECLDTSHMCRLYSEVAVVVNNASLICVAPTWTINTDAYARFSVVHANNGSTTAQPKYVVIKSDLKPVFVGLSKASWRPIDAVGSAMGAHPLNLSGSDFCHSSSASQCLNEYVCEFVSLTYTEQIVNASQCSGSPFRACSNQNDCGAKSICTSKISAATVISKVVDSTSLICVTPYWPFAAHTTQVNLYEIVNGLLAPLGAIGSSAGSYTYEYALTSINPTSSGASSSFGRNVTLFGAGFNTSSQHAECRFQGSDGVSLTAAVILSASLASCPIPQLEWYEIAGPQQVVLMNASSSDSRASPTHPSVFLVYVQEWLGLGSCTAASGEPACSTIRAAARGGVILSVDVWGLNTSTKYELRFEGSSGDAVLAPVTFNTSSLDKSSFATAVVPTWPFPAATASVTLWRKEPGAQQKISLISSTLVPFDFYEVVSYHDHLHSDGPACVDGLCWTLNITVHGFGFNVTSRVVRSTVGEPNFVNYSCSLEDIVDARTTLISSRVDVRSPETLFCYFGSQMKAPKYQLSSYQLKVSKGGNEIPSVSPGLNLIEMIDQWTSMTCKTMVGGICQAYASGGEFVSISGIGFSTSARYWCSFSRTNVSIQSQDASVSSTVRMTCKIPIWPVDAGIVTVSVHRQSNESMRYVGATESGSHLTYVPSWWIAPTSYGVPNGSVAGGAGEGAADGHDVLTPPLVVHGVAFSTAATYYIRFVGKTNVDSVAVSVSYEIQATNHNNFTFTVPPFAGREGIVMVELFECDSGSSCQKLLVDVGGSLSHPSRTVLRQYTYVAFWRQVFMSALGGIDLEVLCNMSPNQCWAPASGGAEFTVAGDGFDSSLTAQYRCQFTGALHGDSVYTTSKFVNDSIIICPSPVWKYGAMNTQFTLESRALRLAVPQFFAYNATVIAMLASVDKLIPSAGLSTADKITISGNSFSENASDVYGAHSGPYTCHFFAKSADPWLKERYTEASADFISTSELACNISTWSMRFSAADITVAVSAGNHSSLLRELNRTQTSILLASLPLSISPPPRTRAGMYIKIDKELMLVMQVSDFYSNVTQACPVSFPYQSSTHEQICYNAEHYAALGAGPCDSWCTRDASGGASCGGSEARSCRDVRGVSLFVRRAQLDSIAQPHAAGDHVLSFVPHSVGVGRLWHSLLPAFDSISTTQALAEGETLIHLSGYGFESSLLNTTNTLSGINYDVTQLSGLTALPFFDSNGSYYSMVTFDDTNAKCYADRYPDLYNAFGYNTSQLINHYNVSGNQEGRTFNCDGLFYSMATFDDTNAKCYADRYSDLKNAFGYNTKQLINHYNVFGKTAGRTFNCDGLFYKYWGTSFQVFGNRSTDISEIEMISLYPGKQSVWIYSLDCRLATAFCSLQNQDNTSQAEENMTDNQLNLAAWQSVPFDPHPPSAPQATPRRTSSEYFRTNCSTWDAARAECQVNGGDLVVILDAAKNDAVTAYMQSFTDWGDGCDGKYPWLGASSCSLAGASCNWVDGSTWAYTGPGFAVDDTHLHYDPDLDPPGWGTRSGSTSAARGICERITYSSDLSAEEIIVPASLRYTLKLSSLVPLLKGQTRTFLVISNAGVKYAQNAQQLEACGTATTSEITGSGNYSVDWLGTNGDILFRFTARPASDEIELTHNVSGMQACPDSFPYRSSTNDQVCYSVEQYAALGAGPCASWCTLGASGGAADPSIPCAGGICQDYFAFPYLLGDAQETWTIKVDNAGFHVLKDGRELHVYGHHASFSSFLHTSSSPSDVSVTQKISTVHASGGYCEDLSDAFISVMPGAVIKAETELGSTVPAKFVSFLSPRWRPGSIGYVTRPQYRDYTCVFESGVDIRAVSKPTRAFAVGLDLVDAAHEIACLSPTWPHGQSVVNVSLEILSVPTWEITGSGEYFVDWHDKEGNILFRFWPQPALDEIWLTCNINGSWAESKSPDERDKLKYALGDAQRTWMIFVDDSGFHVLEDDRELHVYSHRSSSKFLSFFHTQITNFSAVNISITMLHGKGLDPVADTDLAGEFRMQGSWSGVKIPSDVYAKGGYQLDLVLVGSSNHSKGAYMCQFVELTGHSQTTEVTVVNSSLAWCLTPLWKFSQTVVSVNVLHSADESLVSLAPGKARKDFSLTGFYEDRCSGDSCRACLGWPCKEVTFQLNVSQIKLSILEIWDASIHPTIGPARGASNVTLSGAGFTTNRQYAVVLASTMYAGEVVYVHGFAANQSMQIIWTAPSWNLYFTGLSNFSRMGQSWISVKLLRLTAVASIFNLTQDNGLISFNTQHDLSSDAYAYVRVDGKLHLFSATPSYDSSAVPEQNSTIWNVSTYGNQVAYESAQTENASAAWAQSEVDVFSWVHTERDDGTEWEETLFGFQMCWLDMSLSNASIFAHAKNETLTLNVAAFNTNRRYILNFSALGYWIETKPAYPLSSNSLVVELPQWLHDAGKNITVYTREESSSPTLPPCALSDQLLTFQFLPGWKSVNGTSFLASGGSVIEIKGGGFGEEIFCELHAENYNMTLRAEVIDSETLLCHLRAWLHKAGSVDLSITRHTKSIPFVGVNFTSFVILEGWDFANGIPMEATAKGGEVITILGYGFKFGSSNYSCLFRKPSAENTINTTWVATMTTGANVTSSTEIRCLTPEWGSEFAADASRIQLDIHNGMDIVSYRGGGAEFKTCPLSSADGCSIIFVEVWYPAPGALLFGDVRGGGELPLHGYGFDTGSNYSCVFDSGLEIVASLPTTPTSQSTMTCTVPALTRRANDCDFTLRRNNTVRGVISDSLIFRFASAWARKDVSKGPAKGGSPITVSGAGFDNNLTHFCVFTANASNFTHGDHDAKSIRLSNGLNLVEDPPGSYNSGSCLTPAFPYSGMNVEFRIELVKSGDRVLVEYIGASETGADVFEFVAGWDYVVSGANISDPSDLASGGSQVEIHGYGFALNVSQYLCIFNRLSVNILTHNTSVTTAASLNSTAIVISTGVLLCLTPAWGLHYPVGRVNLVVQDASSVVPYTAGGINTSECAQELRCSIQFTISWSNMFPAAGQALQSTGGVYHVQGFGFDPAANYTCRIAHASGSITFDSISQGTTTRISCVTPVLNFSLTGLRENLMLQLLETVDGRIITSNKLDVGSNMTFVQSWVTTSVSEAPAKGGGMISVGAAGLSQAMLYACNFEFNGSYVSSDAHLLHSGAILPGQSYQELQCSVPYAQVQILASFSILAKTAVEDAAWAVLVNGSSEPILAPFFLTEGWERIDAGTNISNPSAPASGGQTVIVNGYGFDPEAGDYTCVFGYATTDGPPTSTSAASTSTPAPSTSTPAASTSTPAPSTSTPAASTSTPAPSTSTPAASTSTPAPSTSTPAASTSTPAPSTSTPAASTSTPAPSTSTPAPSTSTPAPSTSTPAPSTMTTAATVINHTRLSCLTPAWGSKFASDGRRVDITILANYAASNPPIPLPTISPLPLTNDVTKAGTCNSRMTCSIEFYDFVFSVTPTSVLAQGGESLTLFGSGFDPAAEYACLFGNSRFNSTSSTIQPLNTTHVQCIAPEWDVAGGYYAVKVVKISSLQVVAGNQLPFGIETSWSAKDLSIAPAKYGSRIVVTGAGFMHQRKYFCRFTRHKDMAVTEAQQDEGNFKRLACSTPAWVYSARVVDFDLVYNYTSSVQVSYGGNDTASDLQFTLTEGWDSVSPRMGPASGNTTVQVQGYGFNATGQSYYCTFYQVTATLPLADSNSTSTTAASTSTPAPSTSTPAASTSTLAPSTSTPAPSTSTPAPSTSTPAASTSTPAPSLSVRTVVALVINTTLMECITPGGADAWGVSFVAGPVQGRTAINITRGEGILTVAFTNGSSTEGDTVGCVTASSLASCSFVFLQSWASALSFPTTFEAPGSIYVTITGWGLDLKSNYSCQFSGPSIYSNTVSLANVPDSPTRILCKIPPWPFPLSNKLKLTILDTGQIEDISTPAQAFSVTASAASLPRSTFSSRGGENITVDGFGFHPTGKYICFFVHRDDLLVDEDRVVNATVVSLEGLTCRSPTWSPHDRDVRLVLVSSTTIPQSVRMASCPEHAFVSAGMQCQSLEMVLYPEWVSHTPGHGDRLGGLNGGGPDKDLEPRSPMITVRGFGFDQHRSYRCHFSELTANASLAAIATNDTNASFAASAKPHDCTSPPCWTSGLVLSTFLIFCKPPVWDFTATWVDFTTIVSLLDIQEAHSGNQTYVSIYRQLTSNEASFNFVQINKRPSFQGSSIVVSYSQGSGERVMVANWADYVWEGMSEDGLRVSSETSQNVSFQVACGSCQPWMDLKVYANGSLSFMSPASGFFVFSASLKDDGGTEYGGVDWSESYSYTLEASANPSSYKGIPPELISRVFTVLENSEILRLFIFKPFITNLKPDFSASFGVDERELISIELIYDATYFSSLHPPTVSSDGALSFQVRPFVHGNTSVMVQKTEFSSAANRSFVTSVYFTVEIVPVNNPPTFVLNLSNVRLLEDECNQGCVISSFVRDISKGPDPNVTVSSPLGDDWGENLQNVTFFVYGDTNSSVFIEPPTVSPLGELSLKTRADKNGRYNFSLVLQDNGNGLPGGGNDTSGNAFFSIHIVPVNDAPAFRVRCPLNDSHKLSSSHVPDMFTVNCSEKCYPLASTADDSNTTASPSTDASPGMCTVNIEFREDCISCPGYVSGCNFGAAIPAFITQILASERNAADERDQLLSFVIAEENSSNKQLLDTVPSILASGDLSLCLAMGENGELSFNVTLFDDGGTLDTGVDFSSAFRLRLSVLAVNQRPSFDVCSEANDTKCSCIDAVGSGGRATCCEERILVRKGSGDSYMPAFAFNIFKGRINPSGQDPEKGQSAIFFVDTVAIITESESASGFTAITSNISSDLFSVAPRINETGFLEFSVSHATYGQAQFNVTLIDDGGQANGGANVSVVRILRIAVIQSYVTIEIFLDTSLLLTHQSVQDFIRRIIAQETSTELSLVLKSECLSTRRRQLLAASSFSVQVVAFSTEALIRTLAAMSNVTTALRKVVGENATIDSEAFLTDAQMHTSPRFNLSMAEVTVVQTHHPRGSPYVQSNFIMDLVPPTNIPLSSEREPLVKIIVKPLRYLPDGGQWIHGTDGGIFASGPNVTIDFRLSCWLLNGEWVFEQTTSPCSGNGSLSLETRDGFSGLVEFELILKDGNFSRPFQVRVLAVNRPPQFSIPELVDLDEDFPCSNSSRLTLQHAVFVTPPDIVSFPHFVTDITAGSQESDRTTQNVSFGVVLLAGDATAFRVFPSIRAQIGAATNSAMLDFALHPHRNGNFTFNVFASDDGPTEHGGVNMSSVIFTLVVRAVNDEPQFELVPNATVIEDEGGKNLSVASNVVAGVLSAMEDSQILHFEVSTDANWSRSFLTLPTMFSSQTSLSNSTSWLMFVQTSANFFGTISIDVTLVDDGGTENGGDCRGVNSLTRPFQIFVLSVNDAPSFDLQSSAVTVLEDGPLYSNLLAVNVTAGPNEQTQTLTFILTAITENSARHFEVQPHLLTNGTLIFKPARDEYASVKYNVTLVDDGGSGRGGWDTSRPTQFSIDIVPVNDAPSFDLLQDIVIVLEDSANFSRSLAVNISAGSANENHQCLTFQLCPVAATRLRPLVPPLTCACGNAPEWIAFESCESGSLSITTSFDIAPRIDGNGKLVFTPAHDYFGSIKYNVTLIDCEGNTTGGIATSSVHFLTVEIAPVNDAPSFDLISDTVSVLEDFPLYVQQVAINVSAGAANEAFQCLTFVVSNCSDELLLYFDIVPHLHANGTLVFKTAHNAAGFIVCNVSLVDCLGASSNGSFSSSFKALGFQVTAVNDAPTFKFTNITVLEDEYTNTSYESSAHVFSISQGSSHSHEQAQALSFVIARIEIESPELMLFQELPRILWLNNINASISFRTVQHQFGVAYVHFYLQVFSLALLLLAHITPGSLVFLCACLMGCRMTAGAHMMAYSILAYMSCTFTSRL
jgi:hypothetical protein